MSTVLGIDLGTQSVKVVFYDFKSREIAAVGNAPLKLHQTSDGVAEQDAEWWIQGLRQALQGVDQAVRKSAVAIGVSGQQHGFVPLDRLGKVLAPVKLWCDTSTSAESLEIMDAFGGPEACIDACGNPILPGYTASKIRWLKKSRPDLYDKLSCVLLPHDYLNAHLTGELCMEAGDASGTGFLDVRNRVWSRDMLRAIDPDRDLSDCLPPLRVENEAIGFLRPEVGEAFGLPSGIPVAIGGGDNMMGAIGTANVRRGELTISLGTSGTVYAFADKPVIDPKGEIAAFCSSTGGWLPLLCTMNCTVTTELMRTLMGTDLDAFEAYISSAPRGAGGVITVPFFNGERTPNLPNARGCLVGLSANNMNRENLMRSAVEGATFALKSGIDRLAELGVKAEQIAVTGGGAKSAAWRQIVADICSAPAVVYEHDEGASFGAALQALQLLDNGKTIVELAEEHMRIDSDSSCEPHDGAVRQYQDFYNDYQHAVAAVTSMYQ